jgi:hypothetical protein
MAFLEKWEYKLVDSREIGNKFTFDRGKYFSHIEGELNEFGKEGWELWEMVGINSTQFNQCFIFRRRVAP